MLGFWGVWGILETHRGNRPERWFFRELQERWQVDQSADDPMISDSLDEEDLVGLAQVLAGVVDRNIAVA